MAETEKIRFLGYNLDHEKVDVTISGIYERVSTDIEITLSTTDILRYNHVFVDKKYNLHEPIQVKKIRLSLITEGIFHDMTIIMQGTAYVMNANGDTVDTLRSKRDSV
jgi:hypothetical protein